MGFFGGSGGDKPELGEFKDLRCSSSLLAGAVERLGRKGWHIADGRHNTFDVRDKFRKAHTTNASEQGGSGGVKSLTPNGAVQNHTLATSQMPVHGHTASLQRKTSTGSSTNGAASGNNTSGSFPVSVSNAGGGASHPHGLSMNSHTNEPQHIIVVTFQYSGVKVAGVTP